MLLNDPICIRIYHLQLPLYVASRLPLQKKVKILFNYLIF